MFPAEQRFLSVALGVSPGEGPVPFNASVRDMDQRKNYTIHGISSSFDYDIENLDAAFEVGDDIALEVAARYIPSLSPSVHTITVDKDGLLASLCSDPEEDEALYIDYPEIENTPSLQGVPSIKVDEMEEVDRLGRNIDLMTIKSDPSKKLVWKYNQISTGEGLMWRELHILTILRKHSHPNIRPLEHLVLSSNPKPQILGFTTPFIAGGSLRDTFPKRTIKIKYIKQLFLVIDFLNLELGLQHLDIQPRNLAVNPETDDLVLFNFDLAAKVGSKECEKGEYDINYAILTIYELVTGDFHFRETKHTRRGSCQKEAQATMDMELWPMNGRFDCEIPKVRDTLKKWVSIREKSKKKVTGVDFDIPPRPKIELRDNRYCVIGGTADGTVITAVKGGGEFIDWRRVPYEIAYAEKSEHKKRKIEA